MSRRQKFMCGVPKDECTGGLLQTDQHFDTNKCHTTRQEAFKCMTRHLTKQGYVRVGSREFQMGDGPIRLLPKQSKFGGRLRAGKLGERYMPDSSKHDKGVDSGLVF